MSATEAYKGHCVLCKDVLSFVFQTFDFCVLAFVFCPVSLNGAMETQKGSDKNGNVIILVRLSYFNLLPFLSAFPPFINCHTVLSSQLLFPPRSRVK